MIKFKSFFKNLFSRNVVVATSDKIKGSYSQGSRDSPGVWWKS